MLDRAMRAGAFGKNNRHVDFPEYFVIPGEDKAKYRLWCVVVHLDLKRCVVFGHYICFVRQDDRWYKCDDETISPAREEEVFSQRACMLWYMREEPFTTMPEYPLLLPEDGPVEQPTCDETDSQDDSAAESTVGSVGNARIIDPEA